MSFNSFIFILLFLPLTVAGYFALNHYRKYTIANLYLIVLSVWFLGYYNIKYVFVLAASIIVNYALSLGVRKLKSRSAKKLVLAAGIICNVLSLFYFKYYNFFISNINSIFSQSLQMRQILLPVGISFYTFQQIAYLVDAYRAENDDVSFVEYVLSVVYFPHLASGPIFLHGDVIEQFRDQDRRKLSYQNLSHGLYIFSIGLFKKVILADTLASAVNWGFSNLDALTSLDVAVISLCYTFQLYFDFSGYCDMAIGSSKMLNIDLPANFDSPYKATSIIDFWNRWHLTLTQFLREYIYFPLGGSRKGKVRTYLNIMLIFLVSGIWHGANWTFIVWGLLHGLLNCLNRVFKKTWSKANQVFQWFATFSCVNILWLVFRSESISQALTLIKKMLCMDTLAIHKEIVACLTLPEISALENMSFLAGLNLLKYFSGRIWGFELWLLLAVSFFIVLNLKNSSQLKSSDNIWRIPVTVIFLVWSMVSFTGVTTFIYAGF